METPEGARLEPVEGLGQAPEEESGQLGGDHSWIPRRLEELGRSSWEWLRREVPETPARWIRRYGGPP